jgi:hypothetical protein
MLANGNLLVSRKVYPGEYVSGPQKANCSELENEPDSSRGRRGCHSDQEYCGKTAERGRSYLSDIRIHDGNS